MNAAPTFEQRTLHRRRWSVAAIIVLMFVFLLLINLRGYLFIRRAGDQLELSLDQRLRTAASTASIAIENDLNSIYNPNDLLLIRFSLERIREQSELEAAYLIDSNQNILVDAQFQPPFPSRGYLAQDSSVIRRALETGLATSPIYRVAGNPFKNAYAEVLDLDGNAALLVLEANADFFNMLAFYRNSLLISSIVSALLFISLSIFLIIAATRFFRTEQELQESQRLAGLGRMAATMAHEIRNPLGIIKSTSDLIREQHDNESDEELFDFINDEIRRLNRLVNDFLTFSRKPALNLEPCRLDQILTDAVDAVRKDLSALINLHLDEKQTLHADCDRDKLHQVLLNIILNADQALGSTGGTIDVSLAATRVRTRHMAVLQIEDDGPGFSGDLDSVFEPFFTTKTKGTGLGLAVSKAIIEQHGGTIEAENRNEGGARIRIRLPARLK